MAFSKARRLGDLVTNTDGDLTAVDDINTSKLIASTKIGSGASITPSNFFHAKGDTNGSGITIQRASTVTDTYGQLSFINTTTDNHSPPMWIRGFRSSGGVNVGDMSFGTNDTERLRIIGSDGDVGIGTSSPGAKLEVAGSSNSTYLKVGGDDASNGRGLTFTSSASASFNGAVHTITAPSSQGAIALKGYNTEGLRVISDGKVGIGTTSPSYMLTVKSSSSNHFRMENGSEIGVLTLDSSGDISLWAHGDENIKFLNGTGSGTLRAQIHPDGEFSIPGQPCLTATRGSDISNVTHGTAHAIGFANEYFDIGSNYDGTYFTAPEDGMYLVTVSMRIQQVESNLPYCQVYLTASNNVYYIDLKSFDDIANQQVTFFRMNGSVVCHLDAGDTAYVRFYLDHLPSGSATTDIDSESMLSIIKVS